MSTANTQSLYFLSSSDYKDNKFKVQSEKDYQDTYIRSERKISYFRNCRCKIPRTVNLNVALHWIKTGSSKETIKMIRGAKDQPTKNLLKQNLPGVTFGGLFEGRSTLIKASGLACLDFDKLDNLYEISVRLKASEYIYALWVSPSGNGLKALIKIPLVQDKDEYQEYYRAILMHFQDLQPDTATKDINRLCFESYDPYLHINEEANVFSKKIKFKPKTNLNVTVKSKLPEGKIIDRIVCWWVKKFPFAPGSRNNNLFILACALSNFGLDKKTTEELFISFEDEDFHCDEIRQIIDSAYKKADFNSQSFPQ